MMRDLAIYILGLLLLLTGGVSCNGLLEWTGGDPTPKGCEGPVGEWQFLGLDDVSDLEDLAVDPNFPGVIYIATSFEVYRSTNCGKAWEMIRSESGTPDVEVHREDPEAVYIVDSKGVWRGADRGERWNLLSEGVSFGVESTPSTLALSPASPHTIYVGTSGPFGGPALKTTDGGESWKNISDEKRPSSVTSWAFHPSDPQMLYVGNRPGILKTTDGGETWQQMTEGDLARVFLVDAKSPQTVYGQESIDTVLVKSTDGGETWSPFTTGLPPEHTEPLDLVQDKQAGTLYLLTRAGVFTSEGDRWSSLEIEQFEIEKGWSAGGVAVVEEDRSLYVLANGVYRMKLP